MTTSPIAPVSPVQLKRKDFQSDQEVRWCPACGDYAILSQVQKVFAGLGMPKEQFAIISGIGCSSRFPYYMNTYGFHTIHGRAPGVATGLKIAHPELSVWVVTGDGDALSIGGNHIIHAIRRNIGIKIILFNNQIYGLTKGQYSPTSEMGKKTKSSPMGSIDRPLNPLAVALGAEATFVARSFDKDQKLMASIFEAAAHHEGTAFIEIEQNCRIFNDGAFELFTEKATKAEHQLVLEDGKPLVFGAEGEQGIVFDGFTPKVVNVADVGIDAIHVHDANGPLAYQYALAEFAENTELPVPVGIMRQVSKPSYEGLLMDQLEQAQADTGRGTLEELLGSGDTWKVG